jgi:hypothetical protein
MARLAETDVTVTVLSKGVVGKKRRMYGTLTFDSTTLTYTIATGIPLPAYQYFGFMKQMDIMFFTQDVGAGATELVYKYDPTNQSIRVYRVAGFTPAGSVAAPVFTAVGGTPAGSVSAPVFTGTAYVQSDGVTTAPVGSVAAPVFTGDGLTIAGSVSAPAFTGTAVAAGSLAEFTDNTALGGEVTLYFDAIGV